MQASPLQLKAYFLKNVNYSLGNDLKSLPESMAEMRGLDIKVQDETGFDETQQLWRSEVRVTGTNRIKEKVPYTFDVVMVGFFRVHDSYPKEQTELMAKTNAPALLYSAIREVIGNMTSRSPFPMIFLPSVTFLRPNKIAPRKSKIKKPVTKRKSVT